MAKLINIVTLVALMTPVTLLRADAPSTAPDIAPTTAPAALPEDLAKATKEVKATIDEAIDLMDKKDYDAVLNRFIPPDELKQIKGNADDYAKMKAEFADKKAELFMKALKEAKAEEPDMQSAEKGVYKVTTGGSELKVMKVDGKWYID